MDFGTSDDALILKSRHFIAFNLGNMGQPYIVMGGGRPIFLPKYSGYLTGISYKGILDGFARHLDIFKLSVLVSEKQCVSGISSR